jgi:hypothetical protein
MSDAPTIGGFGMKHGHQPQYPNVMRQQANANAYMKYGLLPLRIGCMAVVACNDGTPRQFTASDLTRAEKNVKTSCRCLTCNKDWATKEELEAAHPETRIMKKNHESHVWAYWQEQEVKGPDASKLVVRALYSDAELDQGE